MTLFSAEVSRIRRTYGAPGSTKAKQSGRPKHQTMLNKLVRIAKAVRNARGVATQATLSLEQKYPIISVQTADKQLKFHCYWLRDHCQCPVCKSKTMQRTVDLLTIPLGIRPKFFHVADDKLHVVWPKLTTSLTGVQSNEHESVYPLEWLQRHEYPAETTNGTGISTSAKKLPIKMWGSELDIDNISTPLESMLTGNIMDVKSVDADNAGLKAFLTTLEQHGIAFVSGLPVDEAQTEKFINLLFPVLRNTHYGTFWKFTADFKHGDLAYSNQALAPHTDTTYFTDPVGLQMWHLLEHNGSGGTSLYIDGFNVAEQLALSDPKAYKVLSETKIATHAAGDSTSLFYPSLSRRFPILNHDPITGKLVQVRFNMEDRSVIDYLSSDELMEYYSALRSWQRLLSDDTNMGWIQLPPGSLVVVNNWRVLHGRSSFVGKRTMCGAYVSMDDYKNRYRLSVESGKAKDDL